MELPGSIDQWPMILYPPHAPVQSPVYPGSLLASTGLVYGRSPKGAPRDVIDHRARKAKRYEGRGQYFSNQHLHIILKGT
ncbi:hypothetical protein FJTKL_08345 [Diaporthe vaccinii]|uniref:Uncharacterized protein n=1 Tax=Diaporthe vaccinii TaxID=105482 RepID=A0ABR4ERP2_9PEZI